MEYFENQGDKKLVQQAAESNENQINEPLVTKAAERAMELSNLCGEATTKSLSGLRDGEIVFTPLTLGPVGDRQR